jgi:hypothetical protein
MLGEIIVDKQFCGPPESGNGGYTCGRLAHYIKGPAEVTLRLPPPLNVTMEVHGDATERLTLMQGDQLIAEAKPAKVDLDIESAPSLEEATVASKHYTGFNEHPFATCFVCGPKRDTGDGLWLFPGRLENDERVAAPWTPAPSLAEDGKIRQEFIWSALDCPGSYGVLKAELKPIVLGRMAACILSDITPEEPYIVTGWSLGVDGRKCYAGTALYKVSGELIAYAKATWFLLGGN